MILPATIVDFTIEVDALYVVFLDGAASGFYLCSGWCSNQQFAEDRVASKATKIQDKWPALAIL